MFVTVSHLHLSLMFAGKARGLAFSITTLSITTLSQIKSNIETNDSQHKGRVWLCCVIYADCRVLSVCRKLGLYAECQNAECH